MYKVLFSAILISGISCTTPNTTEETVKASAKTEAPADAVPFAGFWVREEYVNQVRKYQSPSLAQEDLNESCIRIPEKTGESTSVVYNFHDGGSEAVILKKGQDFQLCELRQPDE